jgi:hypothetical protein
MLSARIPLFFLTACNTVTLNQDNNLSQNLLYYVDLLFWTGALLLAESVNFEVQCVLDIFDSLNLLGLFVLFPYKSLSASFFSVKFLYLCTQFARMILDENNSFNVQTTNSLLAKFNLRERISESDALSRYINALKLTQTFEGVTTGASGGALYKFTTISVATDCFENAPKTSALLSHLKRQFSLLEISATA